MGKCIFPILAPAFPANRKDVNILEQHFFNIRPSGHNRSKAISPYNGADSGGYASENENGGFDFNINGESHKSRTQHNNTKSVGSITKHCTGINIFTAVLAAVFFAVGIFIPRGLTSRIFFFAAYALSGYDIMLSIPKKLSEKALPDKNFFIAVSTFCAFVSEHFAEAAAVMLLFRITGTLEEFVISGCTRTIKSKFLAKPEKATVIRGGSPVYCKPEKVYVGEKVIVNVGEKIPLDGKVVSGESLIDISPLYGQSSPAGVKAGSPVLSGCVNLKAPIVIEVTAPFAKSVSAKIISVNRCAMCGKAAPEKFIAEAAKHYMPFSCAAAVAVAAAAPFIFGDTFGVWLYRALIFLVISCPSSFVSSVSLIFLNAVASLSENGILVKSSETIEAIRNLHTVAFAKSGILTYGNPCVRAVITVDGISEADVLSLAAAAESGSAHPFAKAIMDAKPGFKPIVPDSSSFHEYPGKGIHLVSDKYDIFVGSSEFFTEQKIEFFPADSKYDTVYVAINGKFIGVILISDNIRSDAESTITALKGCGIKKTVLFTGDCEAAAKSTAGALGIDEYFSSQSARQKAEKIRNINVALPKGQASAFIGRAAYDASALAAADIGITTGGFATETDAAAADIIFMPNDIGKLPKAVKLSKNAHSKALLSILLAFSVKAILMFLAACGFMTMWLALIIDTAAAVIAVLGSIRGAE